MEDYPRTLSKFRARFATEEACEAYILWSVELSAYPSLVFKKSLFLALGLMFIIGLPAFAEDALKKQTMEEMVVTGSRTKVPLEETTKSIDVIYARDREEPQQYWLPELIDNPPGVFLIRLGGLGQFSSISNLDQVEVLKGTNSVLYDSSAMGGVINIIDKKWQKGLSADFRNEVGPNSTYIGNARLAYGQDRYYIDINPLYVTTDGEKYGGEHGYYHDNKNLTFGAGVRPTDNTSLEFSTIAYDTDLAMGSSPSLDANHNLIKNQADPTQHREGQVYQLGLN